MRLKTILLPEVVYDARASNGIWCRLPYPNHPKGCPNFPRCTEQAKYFWQRFCAGKNLTWYVAIEEFDLEQHIVKMKNLHPKWTERQCKNLLYWQRTVDKKLLEKAYQIKSEVRGDVILTRPEACGINVFATMAKVGIILQKNPNIIKKIMFIGTRFKPE